MTATMGRHYDLSGDYLCFDVMHHAITTLAWPYINVSLHDKHHQICLALEGFACGEKIDIYKGLISCLDKHVSGRELGGIESCQRMASWTKPLWLSLGCQMHISSQTDGTSRTRALKTFWQSNLRVDQGICATNVDCSK